MNSLDRPEEFAALASAEQAQVVPKVCNAIFPNSISVLLFHSWCARFTQSFFISGGPCVRRYGELVSMPHAC